MFMFLYAIAAAIVAIVAGILLAVRSKKDQDVVYGKLDRAGRILNIVLIPVCAFLSIYCMAFSLFCYPNHKGFLGILGWIVCIIIGSEPLLCGLGLGFSARLRKKGRSKLSFAMQFLGVAGWSVCMLMFYVFYGNLLAPLN